MAKITRRSYKRKKVVLGVSIFASIALISTGFAAFVIAKNAEANKDGNVVVGTVKDAAIGFVGVKQSADSFVFDCKADDDSGRVYYQDEGNGGERLTITITGGITNPDYLKSGTIQMTVPASVTAAVAKNYIVLPDCVDTAQNLTFTEYTVVANDAFNTSTDKVAVGTKVKKFSYDITFTWGTAFNGKNPGEYYDEDEEGKAVAYETVKSTMEDFYAKLKTSDKYNVTLKATANA